MKTQQELIALANEIKELGNKLKELSEEELQQVTGGDIHTKPLYGLPDGQIIAGPHVIPWFVAQWQIKVDTAMKTLKELIALTNEMKDRDSKLKEQPKVAPGKKPS